METTVFDADDPAFEAALALRERVFVDEQGVPHDREVDGKDSEATHFLVHEKDEPVATARVRATDDGRSLKVERVAVARQRRGEGYGDAVMDAVESYAAAEGYDQLVLAAQVPVVGFYERRGYRLEDDEPFDDAGIPHRRMAKPL